MEPRWGKLGGSKTPILQKTTEPPHILDRVPQAQRYASGKAEIPEKVAKLLRAMIALGTTEV